MGRDVRSHVRRRPAQDRHVVAWGDVPNWIAASAALLAVVFAWLAARHTRALLEREVARDRRATAREVRAQADLVGAWVASRVTPVGGGDVTFHEYGLVVRNASSAPVFDVVVASSGHNGEEQRALTLAVLPPGEFYSPVTTDEWVWGLPDPVDAIDGVIRPVMRRKQRRVTSVTFRDSAGSTWIRDDVGRLACTQPTSTEAG
jgi:hypothetical protein